MREGYKSPPFSLSSSLKLVNQVELKHCKRVQGKISYSQENMKVFIFIIASIVSVAVQADHQGYKAATTPAPSCDPGCQNGGVCVAGECKCKDGFQGALCEIETCKKFTIRYVTTGQCISVNKQNNLFISDQCDTLFTLSKEGRLMDDEGKRCFNGPAFNFRFNFLVSVSCSNAGTIYGTTKGGSLLQKSTGTCINLFVGVLTVLDTVCDVDASKFAFDQGRCDKCNPCENGAECVQHDKSYECKCKPGFTGCNCEINIDECASNPCQNGATCVDGINSFTCQCVPGYTGKVCETDINECASNPCGYRGTCVDCVNEFKCVCNHGYYGQTCDKRRYCSYKCSSYKRHTFRPVCASNGRVFRNKCELEEYKCSDKSIKEVSCYKYGKKYGGYH